jgi:hypothetical protein
VANRPATGQTTKETNMRSYSDDGDKQKPADQAAGDSGQVPADFSQSPRQKGAGQGRTGRPTRLTDELIDEFVALVKRCFYLSTAAEALGIDESLAYLWHRLGKAEALRERKGKPLKSPNAQLYIRFHVEIMRANALAEIELLEEIRDAKSNLWTAKAWILERTRPGKFCLRDRKELAELDERLKEMEANTPRNPRKPKNDEPS